MSSTERARLVERAGVIALLLAVCVGTSGTAVAVESAAASPDPSTPPEATLEEYERFGGTVTDEDGEPILGAEVSVNVTDETATTNVNGRYSLSVGAGTYELTVSAEGYEEWTETVTVDPYSRTDVTLERPPTELAGNVTSTEGEPIANATVAVLETDTETITAENGSFAFGLEAGDYTLEVAADGYVTMRSSTAVTEYGTSTTTIELPAAEGDDDETDDEEQVDDGDESDGADDEDEHEGDDDGGWDSADPVGGEPDDGSTGAAAAESNGGPSVHDQAVTILFFAATFVGTLVAAATVGLYRDRIQES